MHGARAGGMLASWMRLKYPHILDGAIAGSAPIWSYLGEHPVHRPRWKLYCGILLVKT